MLQYFRGDEGRGPSKSFRPCGKNCAADPVVSNLDVHQGGGADVGGQRQVPHENVLRLEVTVDDAVAVQVGQSFDHLMTSKERSREVRWTLYC